jgi:hypothetical protein
VSESCLDTLQKLRELPPERYGELDVHLTVCAECRAMAERLRASAGAPAPVDPAGPLRPLPLRAPSARSPEQNPLLKLLVVLLGIGVILGLTAPRLLDAYRARNYGAPELPGGVDAVAAWGRAGPPRSPVLAFTLRVRQVGAMVAAPALAPPRSSIWAAVTTAEPATVTVCVAGPQGDERLWTGRLDLGRRDVPDSGYRVEKTGRYTFGVSLGETCAAPVHSAWVDVPP